jgi:hypothetical protein
MLEPCQPAVTALAWQNVIPQKSKNNHRACPEIAEKDPWAISVASSVKIFRSMLSGMEIPALEPCQPAVRALARQNVIPQKSKNNHRACPEIAEKDPWAIALGALYHGFSIHACSRKIQE